MNSKIIAWDLGTGGNKASLYDVDGRCIEAVFMPYNTTYPAHAWHEPETRRLVESGGGKHPAADCQNGGGH